MIPDSPGLMAVWNPVWSDEDVQVRFAEVDGEDGVWIGREIEDGD